MKYINKLILLTLFYSIIFLFSANSVALAENICDINTCKDNQILVKFKKPNQKFLENFSKTYNLSYSAEENRDYKNGYVVFGLAESDDLQSKINELSHNSKVKNVQPNYIFKPAKKNSSAQDKYFKREWWLYNNGLVGTAGSDIYLLNIWQQEQKTWPGVIVGIIDSGINQKHKDLKKNIIRGYDFVHNKSTGMKDKEGHGSFIAGLIASEVSNKKGIAGLSRLNRLKVMPLKFDFSTDEAISAIAYAQAKGVRILNTSWGTNEYDQALYEAISAYNGLIISASGNEAQEHNSSNHFYPCDFDLENVICVGASDENDRITDYSDYGQSVDLLAPGGSEGAPMISLDTRTNRYVESIGSSYSTALVSGAAGLVLSANPTISNLEIKNLLIANVRTKEDLVGKVSTGGILNVRGAVNREIQ